MFERVTDDSVWRTIAEHKDIAQEMDSTRILWIGSVAKSSPDMDTFLSSARAGDLQRIRQFQYLNDGDVVYAVLVGNKHETTKWFIVCLIQPDSLDHTQQVVQSTPLTIFETVHIVDQTRKDLDQYLEPTWKLVLRHLFHRKEKHGEDEGSGSRN